MDYHMHIDIGRHRELKKTYCLPEDALVWADRTLCRHFERLCGPAYAGWVRSQDPEIHQAWREARARKARGERWAHNRKPPIDLSAVAAKSLRDRGRPPYSILLQQEPAKDLGYRPCLGWTKHLSNATGFPCVVWLPRGRFGPSKQYLDGLKRESASWRRIDTQQRRARDNALKTEVAIAVAAAEQRNQSDQQQREALSLPENAVLCRDGGCRRWFVRDAGDAPEGAEGCFRCSRRPWLGKRYPMSRAVA